MIYFIRAGESGPIKIGSSGSPETRMRKFFQPGNHEALSLIRTLPGGAADEHWFHARFNHRRIRGEWFHFDPLMLTIAPPPVAPFDYVAYLQWKAAALEISNQVSA